MAKVKMVREKEEIPENEKETVSAIMSAKNENDTWNLICDIENTQLLFVALLAFGVKYSTKVYKSIRVFNGDISFPLSINRFSWLFSESKLTKAKNEGKEILYWSVSSVEGCEKKDLKELVQNSDLSVENENGYFSIPIEKFGVVTRKVAVKTERKKR